MQEPRAHWDRTTFTRIKQNCKSCLDSKAAAHGMCQKVPSPNLWSADQIQLRQRFFMVHEGPRHNINWLTDVN